VIVSRPAARVEIGRRVPIVGRLARSDGQGIANAPVQVLSRTEVGEEQLVATLETNADGRFRYAATGASTRTLRVAYGGSSLILPADRELQMRVPAATSLRVSRRRVLNGQAVTFAGRVRGLPVPAGGKLVEVQVVLSGHWQTFRTTHSDADGRWTSRYRFRRTRGVLRYRFRARLPKQSDYPFETGASRALVVQVTGE
jgi:5-hydroxyisourate hydrolase-like protein (transthyretin family)